MPEKKGGIKWLKDRLYSRTEPPKPRKRRKLRPESYDVDESWEYGEEYAEEDERPVSRFAAAAQKRTERSPFAWLLIGAAIFFALSLILSAFLFFSGSNVVTAQNIDIDIGGPLSIPGGEELVLNLQVTNRNSVPLELADLIVEYPEGTRTTANLNVELPRQRESLGTIRAGERVKRTLRAVLFGKEDTEQTIKVTVEYRLQGSNAIFYKEKEYDVLISSAPITLNVDSPEEVTSGEEVVLDVMVTSNSNGLIEDVLLEAEYPFGFEFTSATPEPSYSDTAWNLGDLRPGEERTVRLRGILVGQDTEERVFHVRVGTQSEADEGVLAAEFSTLEVPMIIKKPFIQMALAFDGNAGEQDHIVRRGESISGTISWRNNLPTTIFDAQIEVRLTGDALDRSAIESRDGFYRSQDNTIVFSKETAAELASIAPGDRGSVGFTFASLPLTPQAKLRNPTIRAEVSVSGKRVLEGDVPEEISSTVSREVKVASNIILTSRVVHTVGPFTNTGPLPPRVEEETTYTVAWSAANTANDIKNAKVTARLPSYVEWLGVTAPSGETIAYDPQSRVVEWNIGDLPQATGYATEPRQVFFQLSFTPSLSQEGSTPQLVVDQQIVGLDQFTGVVLQTGHAPLTTRLSTDPNVRRDHSSVAE